MVVGDSLMTELWTALVRTADGDPSPSADTDVGSARIFGSPTHSFIRPLIGWFLSGSGPYSVIPMRSFA